MILQEGVIMFHRSPRSLPLFYFIVSGTLSRFVTDFFSHPGRGYGENVIDVFRKLRNSKFSDIWKPAREQFNGSGSLGNGGAMRISPVPLFYYSDFPRMLETAAKCTKLTHTHKLGVNGALLQVFNYRTLL